MGLQAGLPPRDYIAATHASLGKDYGPIRGLFSRVIGRTLRDWERRG